MNSLEQANFPQSLSLNEREMIDRQLGQLIPHLEQLNYQSGVVAQEAMRNAHREQLAILDDIVEYNRRLIASNSETLYSVIQKEREIKDTINNKEKSSIDPKKAQNTAMIFGANKKLDTLRLEYIEQLEKVDFVQIGKIKKIDKTCASSFNKIWVWVLEVFYGIPSSKYDWEDFSKKAMSPKHDSGNELRRKLIIYDVKSMSIFQAKELEGITSSDIPLLLDKMPPNDELKKLFDCFELLHSMFKTLQDKMKMKEDIKLSYDIRVQEEEKKALDASKRLNGIKFDIMTDVQNLYVLIDSEFKA